eukprot:687281-Rhodomonas_salina.4
MIVRSLRGYRGRGSGLKSWATDSVRPTRAVGWARAAHGVRVGRVFLVRMRVAVLLAGALTKKGCSSCAVSDGTAWDTGTLATIASLGSQELPDPGDIESVG